MHRPVAPLNDSQGPLEKGREGGLDATTTVLGAQVLLKGECPSMSTQRVRGQGPRMRQATHEGSSPRHAGALREGLGLSMRALHMQHAGLRRPGGDA